MSTTTEQGTTEQTTTTATEKKGTRKSASRKASGGKASKASKNGKSQPRHRTNPAEIMAWTEKRLKSNPDLSSTDLFEAAKEKFPMVKRSMNLRQFHATYPLQVRRRLSGGGRKRRAAAATMPVRAPQKTSRGRPQRSNANGNDAMRSLLLDFAREVRQDRSNDLETLFAQVDRYAERAANI